MNTPGPAECVRRYSSAIRCLRSRLAVDHRDGVLGGRARTRRANRPATRIRRVLSSTASASASTPRSCAATRSGTRPPCSPSGSRHSARSGQRSHKSRSAGPHSAPRSHQPPADRRTAWHFTSAGLPGGAIPSGRSPGRNVVTCNIFSWTDSEISFSGFAGYYGQGGWVVSNGDDIEVEVWNTQSGKGPATCSGRRRERLSY